MGCAILVQFLAQTIFFQNVAGRRYTQPAASGDAQTTKLGTCSGAGWCNSLNKIANLSTCCIWTSQALGRAGRITATGARRHTLLYVLFNSQDLGRNVRDMTEGMRQLCLSSTTCLRELLKKRFVGNYVSSSVPSPGFCCSVCDKLT